MQAAFTGLLGLARGAIAAGSGPTRMLPASLPAGWAPKLRRAYCNHNCFLPCCSAITFISPLDADDPLSSFSYRGIHK